MGKHRRVIDKPSPFLPFKAYAGGVVAAVTAMLAYADVMPIWLVVVLTGIMGFFATYMVPNPR